MWVIRIRLSFEVFIWLYVEPSFKQFLNPAEQSRIRTAWFVVGTLNSKNDKKKARLFYMQTEKYFKNCRKISSKKMITCRYQFHPSFDMHWYIKSYWVWSLWHFVIMMWTGYFTLANVGSMLCPAASDPFSGPDYRMVGIIHQSLSVFVFGTLAALLGETRTRLKPSSLQTGDSKID